MTTQLAAFVGYPDIDSSVVQDATIAEWDSLVNAVGQTPTMMLTYLDSTHPLADWIGDAQWDVESWQASSVFANLIPVIGIPMALTGDNADTDFKAIIAGQWDQTLLGVFQTWANAGYTSIYIRPGYEMNTNSVPWEVTTQNAADFVAAFQHIASLAHSFLGASITVIWNPSEGNESTVPVEDYYPGNKSVDIVGLDEYGPPLGTDTEPSQIATNPGQLTVAGALAIAQANDKPFAMPEVGGTDAAFPANLAAVVAASGVPVSFVGLWDAYAGSLDLEWSQNSATAAAWKHAYNTIEAASNALPTSSSGSTSGSTSTSAPDVITVPASQTSVTVTASAATINATSGNHVFFISGSADTFNVSGGIETVTDSGSGGNTFKLPAAGNGSMIFNAAVLTNGDVFNLTAVLEGTTWKGSSSTLDLYLHTVRSAGDTELLVSATAARHGTGQLLATFDTGNVSLSTILAHSVT